jgi:uncharacterized membrane protein YphA (DoxX/SURF4 family)
MEAMNAGGAVADRPPATALRGSAPNRRFLDAAQVAARLLLASVFLWAGVAKATNRAAAVLAVDAYRVLPHPVVDPVARALPWIEITLGAFLVSGLFIRFTAVGASVLTVVFIVGMAQARARGLAIDCGCFGGNGPGTGVTWLDLARDAGLLVVSLFLVWRPAGPLSLDRLLRLED